MKYLCKCGNTSEIRFSDFKNNVRCMKCSGNINQTYESVQDYFKEQKCELLEDEYINIETKMKYKCSCGNKSEITFHSFQDGHRCKICASIKRKNTVFERYGVEYILQNSDIAEKQFKSSKKYKDYIFPSGNIVKIQGYENFALDELLKTYKENDLLTNKNHMPEIWYIDNIGKYHKYYPDIYIPIDNILIEVKSIYTYNNNIVTFYKKKKACEYLGFNFISFIYDKNKRVYLTL